MAAPRQSSRSPRYVAIAAELRERILDEHLAPHTLVPSERELSEQFEVSRMTARQALMLLESEGYVYRRPPRGTFVAEPRVRFQIGSFSEEADRLGRHASAQLLWAMALTGVGNGATRARADDHHVALELEVPSVHRAVVHRAVVHRAVADLAHGCDDLRRHSRSQPISSADSGCS